MAVNPIISIVYTKKIEGGGENSSPQGITKPQKTIKGTSATNHFNKNKKQNLKFVGKNLMGKSGLGTAMAVLQVADKGVGVYTQVAEGYTGDKLKYGNLRKLSNSIANPIGFAKKAVWDYGIIRPMIIQRQNEMLMYDRRLTGQMIYGEGKQRGIF